MADQDGIGQPQIDVSKAIKNRPGKERNIVFTMLSSLQLSQFLTTVFFKFFINFFVIADPVLYTGPDYDISLAAPAQRVTRPLKKIQCLIKIKFKNNAYSNRDKLSRMVIGIFFAWQR